MNKMLITVLLTVALGGAGMDRAAAGDDVGPPVTCVSWKAEAKFVGVAYNHLVHLHNRCDHGASCEVSTDVNPEAQTVLMGKGEKKTVLTFRGSPAREFKATVVCR